MLKISKMTDYAVIVLGTLVANSHAGTSAADVARQTELPLTTVAKVLKLLAKAGLVTSVRGAAGGYRLARGADQISVPEIIAAIDGPLQLTDCVAGNHACTRGTCLSRGRWDSVNRKILNALNDVPLTTLLPPPVAQIEVRHG